MSNFAINIRSGTPTVKTLNGLSATNVGTSPGTAEAYTTSDQPLNRVIQFGNANSFLVLINGTVRRSTDNGATWSTVLSFSPVNTAKTGLNIIYQNGVATVCFMSTALTTTTYKGYYSTDGINWTTEGPFTSTSATVGLFSDTVFRNSLCALTLIGGGTSSLLTYTPGSGITSITLPAVTSGGSGIGSALCVFNGTLMLLYSRFQLGAPIGGLLYQLSNGNFILANATVLGGTGGTTAGARWGMFVDGSFLYAFTTNNVAWQCYKIDSTFVPTNITTTVLPLGMQSSVAGATARIIPYVDGTASPGSNPTKYIITGEDGVSTTGAFLFQWVDSSTTMIDLDSGGTVATAYSAATNVGGQNFWTDGESSINLVSRSGVSGGIRFSFQLFNTTGTPTAAQVRAFFGNSTAEYPITACTLTNPSSGSMSGNTITGLTIDNGATTYQVTWSNALDGIPTGARYRLVMEVTV